MTGSTDPAVFVVENTSGLSESQTSTALNIFGIDWNAKRGPGHLAQHQRLPNAPVSEWINLQSLEVTRTPKLRSGIHKLLAVQYSSLW